MQQVPGGGGWTGTPGGAGPKAEGRRDGKNMLLQRKGLHRPLRPPAQRKRPKPLSGSLRRAELSSWPGGYGADPTRSSRHPGRLQRTILDKSDPTVADSKPVTLGTRRRKATPFLGRMDDFQPKSAEEDGPRPSKVAVGGT